MFVPTKAFLTKGVGRHREKLTSFEMALRDAHLANFNLVRVSSIFPPHCELVDREEGLSLMKPGQVVFAVIAESATNEPSRLVAASIGVAMPADASHHGYISEHHSYGQNEVTAGEYAQDPAASMLATVLGGPFDSGPAWPRPGARVVVRGRLLPHLHRARRHGVGTRRAAVGLARVDRPDWRHRRRPVRAVPARRLAASISHARAAARAGAQAARLPGLGVRRRHLRRGMDPLHRADPGCDPHARGRSGECVAGHGVARGLTPGARHPRCRARPGAPPRPRLRPP